MEISVAIFIVALVALVIFIRWKMPTWKGKFSERLVYTEMSRLPDEYIIFNDLLFRSNGRSTQIDHVVVSPYGVFVIETKGDMAHSTDVPIIPNAGSPKAKKPSPPPLPLMNGRVRQMFCGSIGDWQAVLRVKLGKIA